MRAQVAAMAVDLFLERGFEETTVEDICARAEISRSTFFRYFPSKEDTLFERTADTGRAWLDALVARPAGEQPWAALRGSLDPRIEQLAAGGENVKRLMRLIVATPALAARHREKNAYWQELLRPEVARRLGAEPGDTADPRADAMIAAALGCLDAALKAWASSDRAAELPVLLDRAMSVVD
ncbi:TetR family transcriptional regulator [Virgisporangium aliadipatigenens]|uniref:TetR family transcriptional regulator n=1 Tax=Virgisporangium aliadipatigenens TaxID=741659 RepID=A0A8J3YW35_9ACTN|nr:TetR family transcriptional regulator [Virgisporangium aliadipatigenens]